MNAAIPLAEPYRFAPAPAVAAFAPALSSEVAHRNARCHCGSGQRFKACCGALATPAGPSGAPTVVSLMQRALALQRDGRLVAAAGLYREALALAPDLPDAVHMLGVTHLQTGEYGAALRHLRRAAELFAWRLPAVRHNLGLAIAATLANRDRPELARLWQAYDRWRNTVLQTDHGAPVRVSVVIPSFNHAAYVEAALESVFRQTYRDLEIVVIDDGSRDRSPELIRETLRRSPFPVQFHVRANRGAATTLNEAVALSRGDFVNVLNSDDQFTPSRVATMVDAIARRCLAWGFSRVAFIDAQSSALATDASPRVAELGYRTDGVAARDTVGTAFLSCNPAICSGALFFARALFDRLGGFRDLRYNHDWDFCLRASVAAEPAFVASPEYHYRLHGANTILESAPAAKAEADAMFERFYREAVALQDAPNPFAPMPAVWGTRFFELALVAGQAALLPDAVLRTIADRILDTPGDGPP